jgi:hypothetical protein
MKGVKKMLGLNLDYNETEKGNLIPNLSLTEEPEVSLGRFARMRLKYLKEEKKLMFSQLLTTMMLTEHLAEIERTAKERIALMTEQRAKAQGLTEQMKMENQMKWVGLMNNTRQTVEQEVIREVVLA